METETQAHVALARNDMVAGATIDQASMTYEWANSVGRDPAESSSIFAQRGVSPELDVTAAHVLVTLTIIFSLVAPLVWAFVRYWLFAP